MLKARSLLVGVLFVGLAIGLTAGLQGVNTASATESDFSNLLAQLKPSVVQVWVEYGEELVDVEEEEVVETAAEQLSPIGSGFILSGGDVVTNFHVVEKAATKAVTVTCLDAERNEVECGTEDVKFRLIRSYTGNIGVVHHEGSVAQVNEVYEATVKKANALHDLALLSTALPKPQRAWLGDSATVARGDGGFSIGYPAPDAEMVITEHQISNFATKEGATPVISVDGNQYQLVPWLTLEPAQFELAMASSPTDEFRLIEVNVTIVKEEGKWTFTTCEAMVEAEDVQCGFGTATLDYLQTDDAINGGNSGGPIFNWNGQVIGITTVEWCHPREECYSEYHITINRAKDILTISN